MEHEPWIFIAVWCLALLIPLAYACNTLWGLRRKTVIPLLRIRDAAGLSQSLSISIPSALHRRSA